MRACIFALLLLCLSACDRLAQRADPLLDELKPAMDMVADIGHTSEEYRKADAELTRALKDRRYPYLTQPEQGRLHAYAAWGALRMDDTARARTHFLKATSLDTEDRENWRMLASMERRLGNHQAAVQSMLAAIKDEKSVDPTNDRGIVLLVADAEPGNADDLKLMQALLDKNWESDSPSAGDVWLRLALERLRLGQRDAARAAIARVTTPTTLVVMRADKRFDGLYDPAAVTSDPREMAMRRAAHLEAQAGWQPRSLQARHRVVDGMLSVGLDEAALRIAEQVFQDAQVEDAFEDEGELDEAIGARSRALLRAGRVREALAIREVVAKPAGERVPSAERVLGLAGLYCGLGRGREAASTADRATQMSPYGRMNQAYLQHCGAVLEGDASGAARALAYLETHHEDSEEAYLAALVRANRLDDAAAVVARRLASETDRGDMLYQLQDFREDVPLSPADAAFIERWKAMQSRPDVQAALDKVGRRLRFDIYG